MDLFEQDKRLTLKPVRDLADLLQNAFGAGVCTCVRCLEHPGDCSTIVAQHTFLIDEAPAHRRFAISSYSDVRGALSKAWEAYYKTKLAERGPVDFESICALVDHDLRPRLRPLLYASAVVTDVESIPQFAAGT